MSSPLPEFERPPLNEVVFGVQFEPLAALRAAHYGLYWSRIRSRYGTTEDKAPLAYVLELNEPKQSAAEISLITEMPTPRVWFVDSEKTGLITGVNGYCRTGDHRREGLFMATGPGIRPGRLARSVSIMDFAPTFCALLGTALPGADGQPIIELVNGVQ